jgi:immune inhibitor A
MSSPFDPAIWYRIRNTSVNPTTHALDVINNSGGDPTLATGLLKIATIGYYAGQFWQFTPIPPSVSASDTGNDNNGIYVMHTWWLGPHRCLTISTNDHNSPVLQDGDAQVWTVGQWGDGTFWFSSTVNGKEKLLDVGEDGRAVVMREMDEGRPSQRWTVEVIRRRRFSEKGYDDNHEIIRARSAPCERLT